MAQPHPALNAQAATPPRSAQPRLTRDQVLDTRQVADLLHLPPSTVLDYARREILPAHKLGRRWIFLHDEIEAGIRNAPNHRHVISGAEPPGRRGGRTTRTWSKRYPETVPAARIDEQPQLFN